MCLLLFRRKVTDDDLVPNGNHTRRAGEDMQLNGTQVLALGTTGSQGSGLVQALEQRGAQPVRVTSDPARAAAWQAADLRAVVADLTDPDSLRAAVRSSGAAAAALHVPLGLAGPQGWASVVAGVSVLRELGLPVAVNIGSPVPAVGAADPWGGRDRAAVLTATGAVVVSPTAYLENHLAPWAAGPLAAGELPYPRPVDDLIAWITARDVTAAAVAGLAGDHGGQLFRLAGPQPLTFADLAEELGAGLGRTLVFREVSAQAYGDMLRPFVGEGPAAAVAGMYGSMPRTPDPSLAPDVGDVWRRLGVTPTPARRWAADVLAPFVAAA